MLQTVTLADKTGADITLHQDSPTSKRVATAASGFYGVTGIRQSIRERPQQHGVIDDSKFQGGKLMVLDLEISSDVSIEDAFTELRAVTAPIIQTLDNGPALIKWREGTSGLELQRLVKVADDFDPPITPVGAIFIVQAQFLAADPRAYSQTENPSVGNTLSGGSGGGMLLPFTFPFTFDESTGGDNTFTLLGNRPTLPRMRIYGACTSPRIRLGSTGQEIVLSGEIEDGSYIELGTNSRGERYCLLNGLTNVTDRINFSATSWFDLEPGTVTLQLFAGTFGPNARLDVFTRAAYA